MKAYIILILKGLIIGLGKIIPGVSGGILAITLGVYEKSLEAINHLFRNFKENIKFLGCLFIGILISVVLMSKVIKFCLDSFYLPTMLLFVGLIAGGLSMLFEHVKGECKVKNVVLLLVSSCFLFSLFNMNKGNILVNDSFNFLILMGFTDAFTMIVPGISGTAILMLFGAYEPVINAISNITVLTMLKANLQVLVPFCIGMLLGIILFVKITAFLFKRYNISMYFVIIGLAVSSTVILVFQAFSRPYTFNELLLGIGLFIVGYFFGNKLDSQES